MKDNRIIQAIIERVDTIKTTPEWLPAWVSKTEPNPPCIVTDEITKQFDGVLNEYYERERIGYFELPQDKSFYTPQADTIVLPEKKQFKSLTGFYSVKAHETIHSTGEYTRCYRDGFSDFKSIDFGSGIYSREELTAEIGACLLLDALGIDTSDAIVSASNYIYLWRSKLNNNSRWIYDTAKLSAEAVDYILDR